MSIVPLVKVTLYGPLREKDVVLDGLQRLGCVHLNDLRASVLEPKEAAAPGTDTREAIQYLRDCPVQRRAVPHGQVDVQTVVREALEIRDRSQDLAEERAQLRKWIADVEPWGDFEMPEWAQDGPLRFQFYTVPLHLMPQMQKVTTPWKVVSRDHRFAYVVIIAASELVDMPGVAVALEGRSLRALRGRLEKVEQEIEELDYRRIGLTLFRDAVRQNLDEADDRSEREQAALRTLDRDDLFALQGWAPSRRAQALRTFASGRGLALTIAAPSAEDNPPTLLDNPQALKGGEGLVEFYRTPGYRTWDPSKSVFFGFALFFGMIFSDAGYGLLLGVVLLAMWKRLALSDSGRAMRGILVALAAWSTMYGVLVGTYFGLTPSRGSWLAALHLLDTNDQSFMMWLAIAIGAAHLSYANLVTAWRRRTSSAALGPIGWAFIIAGGACVGIGGSSPGLSALSSVGTAGLGIGALLVLFFTSERPFSLGPKALLFRLLDGLRGATDITKAFGDVLSYLRLFALGLASFKLAEAFNNLGISSFDFGGAGVLLGLLILVIGHAINFVMAIMGGVVHGLRLNVIEFFNWSLPEDGEGFRTFAKRAGEVSG